MSGKKEITGWVAWHEEKGANLMSLNYADERTAKVLHVYAGYEGESYDSDDLDICWILAEKADWRIRPVKLVFTDEGK